jgi:hypothetical protein
MDYEKLKNEVQEIAKIAASVPEQFQQRCFDLLLTALLRNGEAAGTGKARGGEQKPDPGVEPIKPGDEVGRDTRTQRLPLNAATRAWMARVGVTDGDLAAVLFVEDGDVHFIREPNTSKIATAQKDWALLLALRNSLLSNSMSVDAETVRSMLQARGFYDRTNFASNFKNQKTAALFRAVLEPQGEAQALSNEGQQELGRLIKRLAAEPTR